MSDTREKLWPLIRAASAAWWALDEKPCEHDMYVADALAEHVVLKDDLDPRRVDDADLEEVELGDNCCVDTVGDLIDLLNRVPRHYMLDAVYDSRYGEAPIGGVVVNHGVQEAAIDVQS